MRLTERVRAFGDFLAGKKSFKEILTPLRQIDGDDKNWVSITGSAGRDLTAYDQRYTADVAYFKWLTDPLAARLIEIIADFVVGSGSKLHSDDPTVQTILDEFWFDSVNDFESEEIAMVSEKHIFGELLIVPYVNPISGLTQVARIDPTWIESVTPSDKFPQKTFSVKLKKSNLSKPNGELVTLLRVMDIEQNQASPQFGYTTGDCFYFTMNKIAGKKRGHSHLLRTQEWIDIFGNRMMAQAEREELMNDFVWDVTLKGANDKAIRDFVKDNPRPNPGTVRAHSDAVTWQAITPDVKSTDFANSNRQFLQMVLGAYGIPEHFFALGGDVNFATAKAMSEPTLRAFKRYQKAHKHDLCQLVDYQLERAYLAKRIKERAPKYEIIMDEISSTDLEAMSGAISSLVTSLQTAEAQGWIMQQGAADAFSKLIAQAGIEVESADELSPPKGLIDVANAFKAAIDIRRKSKS